MNQFQNFVLALMTKVYVQTGLEGIGSGISVYILV